MNEYMKLEKKIVELDTQLNELKKDCNDYLGMIRRYRMKINIGLPLAHLHYIDVNDNRLFVSYNDIFGLCIRQIQTPDGLMYDSSNGEPFERCMLKNKYRMNYRKLFMVSQNYYLLVAIAEPSPDGECSIMRLLKPVEDE